MEGKKYNVMMPQQEIFARALKVCIGSYVYIFYASLVVFMGHMEPSADIMSLFSGKLIHYQSKCINKSSII